MKRPLVLPAALLACLLMAGPAAASTLAYSVYSPYREHNVRSGIYTSDPDGSDRTRLTKGRNDFQPQWSPNRTHIAFTRTRSVQEGPTGSKAETTLFSMRADGARKRIVWQGSEPVAGFDWAPDSERLVFSRGGDLYVIDRRGMAEQQLTDATGSEMDPAWSADGTKIAFTGSTISADPTGPGMNEDIYAISSDGGDPVQLTSGTEDDFEAEWSPDGTKLAFISTRGHSSESEDYGSDIYVMAADGSDERALTSDCAYKGGHQWLPGSTRLLYSVHPGDDSCPLSYRSASFIVVNTGTGTAKDVLGYRWHPSFPSLSPSGRWASFSAGVPQEETVDLFRVRLRDGEVRRITDNRKKAHDGDPDW